MERPRGNKVGGGMGRQRGPLLFRFVPALSRVDTMHIFPFGLFGGHSKGRPRQAELSWDCERTPRPRLRVYRCRETACARPADAVPGPRGSREGGSVAASGRASAGSPSLRESWGLGVCGESLVTDLTVGLMGSSDKLEFFHQTNSAWLCP